MLQAANARGKKMIIRTGIVVWALLALVSASAHSGLAVNGTEPGCLSPGGVETLPPAAFTLEVDLLLSPTSFPGQVLLPPTGSRR